MTMQRSERTNRDSVKMAFDCVLEAVHSELRMGDCKYRYVGHDGSECTRDVAAGWKWEDAPVR